MSGPYTAHSVAFNYEGTPPPPPPSTGSLKGVQTQFDEGGPTWQPDTVDQLMAAGINPAFIRFNLTRGHNTGGGSNFTFDPMLFDADIGPYLSAMQAAGVKHTCVLWDAGGQWSGNIPGFVGWSVDMLLYYVAQYPGVLALAEVWNEPNGSWPIANAEYIQLVQTLVPAIRAHSELDSISISIGVTAGIDMGYIQPLIDAGLLDIVDAVSCHKYGSAESIETDLPPLEAAIAAAGKTTPIYLSEWGATTDPDLITKRLTLLRTHPGVIAAAYFPSKDYAAFPDGGLLTDVGAIKPPGMAWVEWWSRVGGANYVSRDPLNTAAYSFLFDNNTRVMWASVDVAILIDGLPGTTLNGVPIYIDGDHTLALDSGGNTLLADFASQFSSTQGSPWEYGYYDGDGVWHQMDWVAVNNRWEVLGVPFEWLRADGMHPRADHWGTVRVKFPDAHRVKVSGMWGRGDGGDGTSVRIRLEDGTLIASGTLRFYAEVPWDIVVDLPAGVFLEFAVNPGPAADNAFDFVGFQAAIYETTDPLTTELPLDIGTTGGGGGGTGALNFSISTDGRLLSITDAADAVLWSAS